MSEYLNYRKPSSQSGPFYSSREYFKDNLRVLKRNLLFCSGLPLSLSQQQLKSRKYFGRYGNVLKVTMLKNIRQMSVYVTYTDAYEASLAIIATNDFEFDRYHKLASIYGTIKYCKYFLKKIQCKNLPNCNYLHVHDKKNEIYINNQLPDEVFDEHYSIAIGLLREVDIKKMIKDRRLVAYDTKVGDVLPCAIQALKRIAKQRELLSNDSQIVNKRCSSVSGSQDLEGPKQSLASSVSLDKNQEICSEEQTYETIASQEQGECLGRNQEFPRLQSLLEGQKKQSLSPYIQRQRQARVSLWESIQTVQIKLIRKILRQPRSKLAVWREAEVRVQQVEEIDFFHRELRELNELRQLCENSIMKEKNEEQERVKFLLIKNIHHSNRFSEKYHNHSSSNGNIRHEKNLVNNNKLY